VDVIGTMDRAGYVGHRRADVVGLLAGDLSDLPPSTRVLDFGAGFGRTALALAGSLPLHFVLADVDPGKLPPDTARLESVGIESGKALPFPDDHFHAAYAVDVLHHVPAAAESVRELRRVLVPGGRLWIVEYDLRRWWVKMIGVVCRLRRMQRRLLTPDELERMMTSAALRGSVRRLDALRMLAVATA